MGKFQSQKSGCTQKGKIVAVEFELVELSFVLSCQIMIKKYQTER